MAVDTSRISRYRSQSLRLLESAPEQMRVTLSRVQGLEGDEAVQAYATEVGR